MPIQPFSHRLWPTTLRAALCLLASAAWTTASPALAFDCPDYNAELDRLRDLEAGATRGALIPAELECLETAYAAAEQQTSKNKISRVLLVNAYAYSTTEWAKLMLRHLDEVDQSDPDLAYLWAIYKYNTDAVANADDVVKWTETALERRDVWTGDVYVSRVFGLMKLRSLAAKLVWEDAEKKFADGDDAIDTDAERAKVKTYSREWVDFAKVSGKDAEEALQLCLSAATQAKACGVEE